MSLIRVSLCAYLKTEHLGCFQVHNVIFHFHGIQNMILTYGNPSYLRIPWNFGPIQFSAWKFQVHYCYVYECLKLCHEQGAGEYWYLSHVSVYSTLWDTSTKHWRATSRIFPQVSHWAPSPMLQQSPGPRRPSISSSPGFLPAPCPSESPLLPLCCGFMVRHRDSPLTWIFNSLVLLSFPHGRSHILISTPFKSNTHSWTCPRACLDSACWSYWKFTTLDPSRLPAIVLYSVR